MGRACETHRDTAGNELKYFSRPLFLGNAGARMLKKTAFG
jgi:hypothetical protein